MTREDKNRKIAEWLDIKHEYLGHEVATGKLPLNCQYCGTAKRWGSGWDTPEPLCRPDFYLNEAANALVLEKMRRPLLVSDWPGCEGWRVDIGVEPLPVDPAWPNAVGGKLRGPTHADRKTAICLAALKLIEMEKAK